MAKRTRFSPKKAKPDAFWVLERVAAVGGGCGRVRKAKIDLKKGEQLLHNVAEMEGRT